MKRLLTTGFTIALLLVSSITFADKDSHRNNGRDPHGKFDNRHHDARGHDRNNNRRSNKRDHDDNWSINLNFGSGGARPFGYNPYGYNMFGYRPAPPARARQPVVIYQNNTYIEPSYSSSYTTRNTTRQGVSLLRESSGRCYERVNDRYGNETRTELPASACDF